ncbi:MAG: hypothetical protein H5T98_09475 [Syntrophomonadaceae bacterium]|nr:hypothetical protein [Syntrophomonadaceae bacterium]
MSISNFTELKAAVANWLERDDLTDRIPEFIAMGEALLNRRLRVKEMEATATITPSISVKYVALPSRYMETLSFTDDLGYKLIAVDSEKLESLAYASSASRPSYYNIASRIDFERVADATYNYTLRYLKRLDIAADATNSVLTAHPDCYLYAALLHSAPFVIDDGRATTWKAFLEVAIKDANNQSNRSLQTLATELPSSGRFNILTG